ncbi:hypothetical protein [Novispirillum itersonii]|uniref:Uncharacterized protein n=1 Tax=Novispirillum itersonii TaxID=189 RepID=A0A7W9ZFZ7_NOVIT|nr:hypothetical protein [Novispirillum itersonii]MBB6210388.1 hypothetical protein [Novispirillum itersonii]
MPLQAILGKVTLLENLGPFVLVWESLSVVCLCVMQGLGLPTDVSAAGVTAAVMAPVAVLALWQLERTFVATGMVTLNDPDNVAAPAE